jgi:hypothetical protein
LLKSGSRGSVSPITSAPRKALTIDQTIPKVERESCGQWSVVIREIVDLGNAEIPAEAKTFKKVKLATLGRNPRDVKHIGEKRTPFGLSSCATSSKSHYYHDHRVNAIATLSWSDQDLAPAGEEEFTFEN